VDPETVRLPVAEGSDIRFVRLSRSQGLSSQRVTSMAQDDHGFLWFGTDYGVDRYDGYRFRVFASQADKAGGPLYVAESKLFIDRSGTLWVGSDDGLDRFDPVNESFVRHHPGRPSDLASPVHHIGQDRAGMLWVSTAGGLYRLDPTNGKTTHFRHDDTEPTSLSSDDVRSSGEDREGTFWVATRQGLDAFDRDHGRVTLHVPLAESRDFGFYEDHTGLFWVRYASGNGLAILNRATGHLTRYSFGREDLPSHPLTGVSSMLEDQDGALWIGTFSDGLLKYDRAHRRFIRYRNDPSNDHSLTENRITTLLQDREKNIWVAFGATAPAYFSTQRASFEVLPLDSRNPDNLGEALVNGIYEDREGTVWMGTTGALVRLDRKSGRLSHIAVPGGGVASDVICMVEDAAGALWIGTSGQGLYRRSPGSDHLTAFRHSNTDPRSLSNDLVIVFLIDHAGTLWVGTGDGLDRFNADTQNFTTFRHSAAGESNTIRDMAEDSTGALWVGTALSGVQRFDPHSGSFTPLGQAQQQSALVRPWLNSVLMDHTGSIWIATQNGLDDFDPRTGQLEHYTTKDGLPSLNVDCVLEDSAGGLWLGSGAGVSHFDPHRKVFTNYTQADGLPGPDFNGWHACFRSRSGEMFIGGFSGAVAFRPDQVVTAASFAPSVALSSFQLFGKPVTPGPGSLLKRPIDLTDQLTLAHAQNSFAFEFAALSFTNPATNRYRYKLEGLDPNWHEVGSDQRYASYTTLPPGRYRFRVQGATIRGPWSEPGVAVDISITPAWWASWWFKTLCAIAALFIILALSFLRVHQVAARVRGRLEERMAERERIARELHDTLLQSIQGLILRLHVAVDRIPKGEPSREMLDRALERAEQVVDEGRVRVKALRAPAGSVLRLPQAVARIVEQLAPADASPFSITVEGGVRELDPIVREEVVLLAREALANAYRHAKAGKIEAEISYADDGLVVRIRDDGQGIDSAVLRGGQPGHFGLLGMRERAKKIHARLGIWSKPGAGTEVEIRVPATIAYRESARRSWHKPWWRRASTLEARDAVP
jgi:ligand-binding sensor domain-containing protein/signal transduction histidine kinase